MEAQKAFSDTLVAKYLDMGYLPHPMPLHTIGIILKYPEFDQHPGEVSDTIPMAEFYAKLGHLIVLTKPKQLENGKEKTSPDGFLNQEENVIEFKRCTTGSTNNIYNNLSAAGKKGESRIRSLWIANHASPVVITTQIIRKYTVSTRVDIVHIIYRGRLVIITRDDYFAGGYNYLLSKFL